MLHNLQRNSLFLYDTKDQMNQKGGLSHFPDFGSFDNGYSPVPEYFPATLWMMLHLKIFWLYLFYNTDV